MKSFYAAKIERSAKKNQRSHLRRTPEDIRRESERMMAHKNALAQQLAQSKASNIQDQKGADQ